MGSFSLHFIFFLFFSVLITNSNSLSHPNPTALVLPISKNPSTLQYVTQINQKTHLESIDVVLDLRSQFLWISRGSNSSFKLINCNSTKCLLAHHTTKAPKCIDTICTITALNPLSKTLLVGNLTENSVTLQSTDGLNPGYIVSTPFFLLSSSQNLTDSHGIAGLGQSPLALPTQLASAFNFSRVFAVCLPPSSIASSQGVIFFGDGPYDFLPGIDVSKLLSYTPLITTQKTQEYFIKITSIQVNGRKLPFNSSILSSISTVNQYTTMESSIYKSFIRIFARAAKAGNLTRVEARAPFELCYKTRTGSGYISAMPAIDLVLQSREVFWRIFETNSMVSVGDDDVACLGFLDGGLKFKGEASIVIGGYQLEDNLLQFDLEGSRLGFTSTLLFRQTSCANFNFTPNVQSFKL